jgi:thioesterase domain-containing protein
MLDFENARLAIESALPYVRKLGVQLVRFEPFKVELLLPFDLSNTNHLGTLHAGALYTFAETVGGAFLLSTGIVEGILAVRRGSIEYLKPVMEDLYGRAVAGEEEVKGWLERYRKEGRVEMPLVIELNLPSSVTAVRAEILYVMKEPRTR